MPVARPEPQEPRVIAHVDMDCFYVQVEQRRNPELRGQPTAVVQYNDWKGGGLIAVSYEARKFGVKRSMRGDEAKMVCPSINLVQVPVARDKADLNVYRSAGSEVVTILSTKGKCERASIDEVYLDLTDAAKEMLLESPPELLELIFEEATKSNILGLPSDVSNREDSVRAWLCRADADYQDKLLSCGAIIVAQLRVKVLEETQFTCSAGIAHNKMLAKLVSGMHKPAQQTVVPSSAVQDFLVSLPIKKMKQLGGKLGSSLQDDLGVNTVGDLLSFTEDKLQEYYGVNTGTWLWKIARGISGEEVEDRLLPKSHGCGKTFPGPKALKNNASVKTWLDRLCEELSERIQSDLNQNKRIAQTLTLYARACKGTSSILRYIKGPNSTVSPANLDCSSLPEDPSLGNKLYIAPNHEEHCEPSLSEKEDYGNNSNLAKQCQIKEEKKVSKKLTEVKGTCSILKFLSQSPVLSEKRKIDSLICSHPGPESSSEPNKAEEHKAAQYVDRNKFNTAGSNSASSSTWMFNVEDIDPAVVEELPPEIQREIHGWIRPPKQSSSKTRGSTISSYFQPAKRSG
ncbi:DNA polymerase eta isoform X2 [Oryza sativa Japonica Group]|uniref:DNA polymerase eta isoform X2 n=1 Tax=Oryza sativa subsp. japonica TaxID=39947 RepID=UPI00339BAA26